MLVDEFETGFSGSRVFHESLFKSVIPTLAILITVSAYVRVVTVEIMAVIVGLLAW